MCWQYLGNVLEIVYKYFKLLILLRSFFLLIKPLWLTVKFFDSDKYKLFPNNPLDPNKSIFIILFFFV